MLHTGGGQTRLAGRAPHWPWTGQAGGPCSTLAMDRQAGGPCSTLAMDGQAGGPCSTLAVDRPGWQAVLHTGRGQARLAGRAPHWPWTGRLVGLAPHWPWTDQAGRSCSTLAVDRPSWWAVLHTGHGRAGWWALLHIGCGQARLAGRAPH